MAYFLNNKRTNKTKTKTHELSEPPARLGKKKKNHKLVILGLKRRHNCRNNTFKNEEYYKNTTSEIENLNGMDSCPETYMSETKLKKNKITSIDL